MLHHLLVNDLLLLVHGLGWLVQLVDHLLNHLVVLLLLGAFIDLLFGAASQELCRVDGGDIVGKIGKFETRIPLEDKGDIFYETANFAYELKVVKLVSFDQVE